MNPIDALEDLVVSLSEFTQRTGEGQKTAFLTPNGLVCAGTESGNGDFAIAVIYPAEWDQEAHQDGMAMTCYSLNGDIEVSDRAKRFAQQALDAILCGDMHPIPVSF